MIVVSNTTPLSELAKVGNQITQAFDAFAIKIYGIIHSKSSLSKPIDYVAIACVPIY
ncbi:MAG: hypothetical protein SXA11_07455 [Cyanobacteriota bacterium]|nr:hypothetical protein [Cyanobacteriota bacterium]